MPAIARNGMSSRLYRIFFSRSSSAALTVVGTAIFFERGIDYLGDKIFDYFNAGRQWKDIKHLYATKPEGLEN
ncbi:ubiquinol-cytochrome C reductase complex subunit oxen [Brevipalpus obovatus]|uniref:ubiquinol-cytochrome C reductase complex subunit oxen n=1 Tax=Brevipalpus obovatus TaxID=246614 RepID=UPI003D9E13FB